MGSAKRKNAGVSDITLLDGGIGQELTQRAPEPPTPLWGTQVMIDHPDILTDIHRDYFAAGATVATSNSYALHRDRLQATPYETRFEELLIAALTTARAARDANVQGGQVAGSIGPLIASYRPDVHPPPEVAIPLYREVATALAQGADFLLCETVASLDHARSVLAGARNLGCPVWLSVTVDDEAGHRLRSGEPVSEIAAIARDCGATTVLANCSAPEAVPAALDALAPAGLPFGAYANGFEKITKDFLNDKPTVDALHARRDLGPEIYARYALDWIDQGATIVGGCCEVGPTHIAELARRLVAAGHRII